MGEQPTAVSPDVRCVGRPQTRVGACLPCCGLCGGKPPARTCSLARGGSLTASSSFLDPPTLKLVSPRDRVACMRDGRVRAACREPRCGTSKRPTRYTSVKERQPGPGADTQLEVRRVASSSDSAPSATQAFQNMHHKKTTAAAPPGRTQPALVRRRPPLPPRDASRITSLIKNLSEGPHQELQSAAGRLIPPFVVPTSMTDGASSDWGQ